MARAPVLLLGELHGIVGPPELAIDLACRLALARSEAVLALEMRNTEQARIDAYLASDGGDADRARLLAGPVWTRPLQDGYTSQSRFEMLERARRLIRAGVRLRIVAIKDGPKEPPAPMAPHIATGQEASAGERQMADALVALARETRGVVIMLVGETHVQKAPDPADPGLHWMGMFVREQIPGTISLYNRYSAGEAWLCVPVGDPMRVERGPQRREDSGRGASGTGWRIERFAKPGPDGVDGVFDVGPARVSEPAIFLLRNSNG